MKRVLKLKNRTTFEYLSRTDFVAACNRDRYVKRLVAGGLTSQVTSLDLATLNLAAAHPTRPLYLRSQIYTLWTRMIKQHSIAERELRFAFLDYINFDFLKPSVRQFFLLTQTKSFTAELEALRKDCGIPIGGFTNTADFENWTHVNAGMDESLVFPNSLRSLALMKLTRFTTKFNRKVTQLFEKFNVLLDHHVPIIYTLFGFNLAGETNIAFYLNRSTFPSHMALSAPTWRVDYPENDKLDLLPKMKFLYPGQIYSLNISLTTPYVSQQELVSLISDNFRYIQADLKKLQTVPDSQDTNFRDGFLMYLLRQDGHSPRQIENLLTARYGRDKVRRAKSITQSTSRFRKLVRAEEMPTK